MRRQERIDSESGIVRWRGKEGEVPTETHLERGSTDLLHNHDAITVVGGVCVVDGDREGAGGIEGQ